VRFAHAGISSFTVMRLVVPSYTFFCAFVKNVWRKKPDPGYEEVSILSDTLNPTLAKATLLFFQIPLFFCYCKIPFTAVFRCCFFQKLKFHQRDAFHWQGNTVLQSKPIVLESYM
jgi:hypothetical protein